MTPSTATVLETADCNRDFFMAYIPSAPRSTGGRGKESACRQSRQRSQPWLARDNRDSLPDVQQGIRHRGHPMRRFLPASLTWRAGLAQAVGKKNKPPRPELEKPAGHRGTPAFHVPGRKHAFPGKRNHAVFRHHLPALPHAPSSCASIQLLSDPTRPRPGAAELRVQHAAPAKGVRYS